MSFTYVSDAFTRGSQLKILTRDLFIMKIYLITKAFRTRFFIFKASFKCSLPTLTPHLLYVHNRAELRFTGVFRLMKILHAFQFSQCSQDTIL